MRRPAAILAALLGAVTASGEGVWSGSAGVELRAFPSAPESPAPGYTTDGALVVDMSYYRDFKDGAARVVVHPFLRIDQHDAKRTRIDLRDLYYERIFERWEWRAGVRTLRWGVAESYSPVDILNQSDMAASPDGAEKLGQPMVEAAYIAPWGTVQTFLLPYARERPFPGEEGRPATRRPIDTNDARYESSAEAWHPGAAIRYSRSAGPWDIGLSHFHGTAREPRLEKRYRPLRGTKDIPVYEIIDQTAVDLQFTRGVWIGRLEAIRRSGQGETFHAAVVGAEYSFRGVGLIAEWLYDERGDEAATPFENDIYLGMRAFLSDERATEIRFGATIDPSDGATRLALAAGRSLGPSIRLTLDAEIWVGPDPRTPGWYGGGDSVVRLSLRRHF